MGKVKTRILGLEEVEEQQKKEQKLKSEEKKLQKKKQAEVQDEGKIDKQPIVAKTEIKKKVARKTVAKTHGKKYLQAKKQVEADKYYPIKDAIVLIKKMKTAAFDESVELHLVLMETGLKGEVELPYSTGKKVRVAVVDNKLLDELEKGKIEFDVLVTHPSFMPKLAKFAKVLGPKGLMPNPKAGTISPNPEEIVKKFAKGTLRWKTEPKAPLIHQMIGKVSNEEKNLVANAEKFIEAVGTKNIRKAYMKSTMSPSIKIGLNK